MYIPVILFTQSDKMSSFPFSCLVDRIHNTDKDLWIVYSVLKNELVLRNIIILRCTCTCPWRHKATLENSHYQKFIMSLRRNIHFESIPLLLSCKFVCFQVRFTIIVNSKWTQEIVFNGLDSNKTSWYSGNRVESSSWTDVTDTQTYLYFSVNGYSR